jgi:D-lactate dehydrogenase (quinone)
MISRTVTHEGLLARLRKIVGRRHVLTRSDQTRWFRTGFRFGGGPVLAAVKPGSLVELWQVLRACVTNDKVVIMQAANTGLTGGSTPDGENYDREIVIVNTLRLDAVYPIREGRQVVCFPGATLFSSRAY